MCRSKITIIYEFPISNYLIMMLHLKLNNITKLCVETGALYCKQTFLHIIGIITGWVRLI